ESAAEKPAFQDAFRRRRCLVLADGFYEWEKLGKGKAPHYFHLPGGKPFGFAGLWDSWRAPEGGIIESCTVLTTRANALVAPLHDRMPVILPSEHHAQWLDHSVEDPSRLTSLLQPYPPEQMRSYRVGSRVNSPHNDVPECLERADSDVR